MKYHFNIIYILLLLLIATSCNQQSGESDIVTGNDSFVVKNFNPVSNFQADSSKIVSLSLDYYDAINQGFRIPTIRQSDNGAFQVKFEIKNTSARAARYEYKILYTNETYKFSEVDDSGKENPLSWENFYGSWENTDILVKETGEINPDGKFHLITDEITIVGNPRNEKRYFENGKNDRWKRNPRVGEYRFLLVITQKGDGSENSIPDYVKDIAGFEKYKNKNPFYFINSEEYKKHNDLVCVLGDINLKVYAKPDLGQGVYINPVNFQNIDTMNLTSKNCGQDSSIYENAAFEQFINNIDPSMKFVNIPVVKDIMGDGYTKKDYNWDKAFYKIEEMIATLPGVARKPCETVYSDFESKKIVMRNPGCVEGSWRKESVGIRTRHGFTYGKYRLKCKLTQLLNKDNVWNGITNAIWLLYQQNSGAWNNRRACEKEGFMETYWGGDNDKRVPIINYSEIDFEILKTPPYCPPFDFPPVIQNPTYNQYDVSKWDVPFPEELIKADPMISVACTNWDMACKQPRNFNSGCNEIKHQDKLYYSHRWTDKYRALTQKKYESDDELFASDYYYFQIDWKPNEIIWSIGLSPSNMREVGYMNYEVTSIPNNQMTLIITQEYHNTKWWPGSPYMQENIPFPSKDLIGEIYELVIE
ncbi:MAG: hypothetical protein IPL74_14340 [Bacteroidetes bacterium]|nr:hypothetical protein [Bacteroidota bacterium]